jgi:hypothetical protein
MGTMQLILDGNLFGARLSVAGATTSLPLSTSTLQAGTHVLQVFYSGDASHRASTSASATLTILNTVGTFTFTPTTASTTAIQGKASNPVTLTINPTGGFHSSIKFACTGGLPSGATCSFTPSTLTPSGPDPLTATLTISPASSILRAGRAGFGVTVAGFFFLLAPRRRSLPRLLALLVALATLGALSGCGSGAVDPNGPGPGTLSAGSYAVTITATGASTIQTAIVNLTIQ